jgi:methylated-DNA-[protein]-cysteine S-methyltransferase
LRSISCGATTSYANLAQQIGRPTAVRAVGLANGSNPVGVVVPCHRVIGSNGSLTGYGGGMERKAWLLEHESTTGKFSGKAVHE